MNIDLKTRIEVLPCGKCEDMIDCETCLFQKEAKDLYKQIKADLIREVEKKVRAEVVEKIVKKITIYIDDMKGFYKESQDSSFLCAIAEAQKIRRIIRDME